LAVGCKFPEELKDVPRGLRVETGCRLVKEEEESGSSNKFDSDTESFPLLNIKP
jgi:hypothetical protein